MQAIPSAALDTAQVPARERFPLWHAALSPTHDAGLPDDSDATAFTASARGWLLGKALVLESRSTPQVLRRSPRRIRADQTDHYIIHLQRKGRWIADAAGRSVDAGPGSVLILDMARACDARTTEIENVNIVLARDALDCLLPPFSMHGLMLDGPMGTLLRDHVESLADNLPYMHPEESESVADATCRVIAACLAPSRENIARAGVWLAATRLRQVRAYIDAHISSPQLSAQSICAALGISRTTLYNACEPMGGVTAFIQKRRLRRIHALLADPNERRLISEIAYLFGFVSNAHFSRAFRNTFGYSPREAREIGREALAHTGNPYGSWVRRIDA